VVTGHLTKSIAVYAIRLSQVRNDNNTKTGIHGCIYNHHDLGIQIMTTYIYCKPCNKLFNKETGCEMCNQNNQPNETTITALQEAMTK
jgi:hypothetical protein